MAAGRNKPARSVAEQTVEGVGNAEDGTSAREWCPGQEWTPSVDAAMRDETPREALSGRLGGRKVAQDTEGRTQAVGLWRRRKARGRMKPAPNKVGGRRTERHC